MLERRIHKLKRQLQESRYRLVHMYEEFARPLYEMNFVAVKDVWRMSTNGTCIYFDPDWLQKLDNIELDFILSHQLMHIALGHVERPEYYLGDRYHLAADIVANASLSSFGWNYEKIPHIGKIRRETFFPSVNGASVTSVEAIKYIPIDPSVMKPSERRQFMIDSEKWWDRKNDRGESGIIVLEPNDEDPDDLEYDGPTYGGEIRIRKEIFPDSDGEGDRAQKEEGDEKKSVSENSQKNKLHAISMLRQKMRNSEIGNGEGYLERLWKETNAGTLDWRSMLDRFVQEERNDYSFTPPDRRLQDLDFFLPDYNVFHETVKDVFFMVDTSGSVTDEMLAVAYDEIRQAIEQFNGTLSGTLAFFDIRVYSPTPFCSVQDIRKLRPHGGGGTDYRSIFKYMKRLKNIPSSLVVITDGEGGYPDEAEAGNIPVLWLITGERKAPWGRCVRIDK